MDRHLGDDRDEYLTALDYASVDADIVPTETPEQGRELAITMARRTVAAIQTDAETRQMLRPGYATNADSLTMATHVVAIEFATVAAANNYWRDRPTS